MNILFTSENYFPNVSGVPVVVRYLAEGLYRRGHHITIATQAVEGEPFDDNIGGVVVKRFKIWRDWKHKNQGDIYTYINFIKEQNLDVLIIECSECVTTDILLPYLGELKCKVIFHAHGLSGFDNKFFSFKDSFKHTLGSTYNWFNSRRYFNTIFLKSFKYIDAFMCLSEVDSGLDYIKKNTKKYYILDNAADNIFFNDLIEEGAIRQYVKLQNSKYLVSCANYTVVKNQKDMIKQYYQSSSSHNYSLVCIGSTNNDYYKECQELVISLELKYGHRDVHLLYGVERSKIPSIIKGASLYLVSSRWEQYSISIIEAMTQGVPFISTNVGNARILPGGVTLIDNDKMFEKIDYLLSNVDEYKKYSKAGRVFAYKNCRIDAVVSKLEKIIFDIKKSNKTLMLP